MIVQASTSVGQSYVSFPDSNAMWRVDYWDQDCWLGPGMQYQDIMTGDTIIDSNTYKKIERSGISNCPFVYLIEGYVGAIRKDTVQKKVFYRSPTAQTDILLYEFGLNVGDTLAPGYIAQGIETVDSIDSVLIGNQYRRRMHISGGGIASPCFIIEGIGSNFGLLESLVSFEFGGILMCMKVDTSVIFPSNPSSGQCDTMVAGINDAVIAKFQIMAQPNPFTDQTTIKFQNPNSKSHTLTLYNIQGRLIRSSPEITSGEVVIERGNMSKGLYFFELRSEEGILVSGKLIIE